MTPALTTETKHTEGPWTLCQHLVDHDQCSCGYRGGIWGNGGSVMVCEMGAPNRDEGDDMIPRSPREVQFMDARLIAAAPDLLEALKAATSAINAAIQMGMAEAQGHERTAERLDKEIQAARALARVAIAKAVQS